MSVFWCKGEITKETFLVVTKVGRKDELRVFKSAENTERRYKRYKCMDFDVLRLCGENLYGNRRLESLAVLVDGRDW